MSKTPKPRTKSKVTWMKPPVPTKTDLKEALKRLEKASNLIAVEKAWCQGHYALNAKGSVVPPTDKSAVCFCSYGVLMNTIPSNDAQWTIAYEWLIKALKEFVPDDDEPSLMVYNDSRTHEEVKSLFNKAKEIAKKEIASA